MKKVKMIWIVMLALTISASAQSTQEERMEQDIRVAENVLSTLIRQQYGKRNFLPMEVQGSYTPGFGVTFRIPQVEMFERLMTAGFGEPATVDVRGQGSRSVTVWSWSDSDEMEAPAPPARGGRETLKPRNNINGKAAAGQDSTEARSSKIFLDVAKTFLADYGDLLSQLKPEERILITNRGGHENDFLIAGFSGSSRKLFSAEVTRDEISQLKQGRITRKQFLEKVRIVDTDAATTLDPDLEVFSSMIGRLYREDLSKSYFVQGDVEYERLKDFGAIFYMNVYSSYQQEDMFAMPTIAMARVDQAERDAKVKELYPVFVKDLKTNIVEYGRTLRSLGDKENLVFNVRLTRCKGCNIPETVEFTIKSSVLKEYGIGKISREDAISKIVEKKNGNQ